jgi:hypothetical protein
MPGRPRKNVDRFDELFRDQLFGRNPVEDVLGAADRVLQGDRAEEGMTHPEPFGTRPIAPNAGEFDAISIDVDDAAEGSATEATGQAAPITLVPTSTTNPKRPRTVAAGYLPSTKTLSVIFRDGTLYNYYEVGSLEWANFKRARSKGRFIYTYLDQKPRGFPEEGPMSLFARSSLEAVRASQVKAGGLQPGQSGKSRRGRTDADRDPVHGTRYGSGNLGGSTRGRQ